MNESKRFFFFIEYTMLSFPREYGKSFKKINFYKYIENYLKPKNLLILFFFFFCRGKMKRLIDMKVTEIDEEIVVVMTYN